MHRWIGNLPCWPSWCHRELGPGTEYTHQWMRICWKTHCTGSICINDSLMCSCGNQCPRRQSMPSSILVLRPALQKWEQSWEIRSSNTTSDMVDRGPVKEANVGMVLLNTLDKKELILRTLAGKSWSRRSSSERIVVVSSSLRNGFFWAQAIAYSRRAFWITEHPTWRKQQIPTVLWWA